MKENAQLFKKRCDQVVDGTFSTEGMHSSTDILGFRGRIAVFPPEQQLKQPLIGSL